jgi:hypothetical protein
VVQGELASVEFRNSVSDFLFRLPSINAAYTPEPLQSEANCSSSDHLPGCVTGRPIRLDGSPGLLSPTYFLATVAPLPQMSIRLCLIERAYLPYLQSISAKSTNANHTIVLLSAQDSAAILPAMARYSAILGRRIVVTYRAGDIILPATGNLAADSGKSIFLEESYQQQGNMKTFRWEIPYPCIVELKECPEIPRPSASVQEPREASSAESARQPGALELKNRPA